MSRATWRAAWRLLLVAKLTAFFYLLWLAGKILFFPFLRPRIRLRDFCFRSWSRTVLRVMNARLETAGAAPEPPFFLVANHLSYVDVLVLASRVDAVFIAKADVADWPILGLLCRSIGTLFVDRNLRRDIPRVMAEVDRVLARGQGVILFPEGTSTPGFEVGPFLPSLLEVAARADRPVSYASLSYDSDSKAAPAHLAVCWWGDMEFPGHFWRLLSLPGFTATLTFGVETIRDTDRKPLAEKLRAAVAQQFQPVGGVGASPESV